MKANWGGGVHGAIGLIPVMLGNIKLCDVCDNLQTNNITQ